MKDKILTIVFLGIIYTFSFLYLITDEKDISIEERRKLTNTASLKENFTKNLDPYLTDQFPLRNNALTLNNVFNRYILGNKEDNKVYVKDKFLIEQLYPLDEKSVTHFIEIMNELSKLGNTFYSIIPDKSYFLDGSSYLTIDYDALYKRMEKEIEMSNINITNLLTLEDYYQTDIHLKQNAYFKIIEELSKYLNFEIQTINYEEIHYSHFKGSSFYKVPFQKEETITILNNDLLKKSKVKHLEFNDNFIYNENALASFDPYNVFLSGPSSFIELEQENSNTEKELILFRDSFGSSIAPLLMPYYRKITLIDLRYINLNTVKEMVDFTNKDILFLYSTLIVNNSFILKA